MFRAIILPIFRKTTLCITACGIMPAGSLEAQELRFQATGRHYTGVLYHKL